MAQFFSNVVITRCQINLVALNEDVGWANLEGTQGLGGGDLLSVWAIIPKVDPSWEEWVMVHISSAEW